MFTGAQRVYQATDSDEVYLRQINQLAPVGPKLELRVGAQVMLAKNVSVQEGLVNGARGVVVGFEKGNEGKYTYKYFFHKYHIISLRSDYNYI